MDYQIVISPEARSQIDRDLEFIRRGASTEDADRWFTGLVAAIESLATMPTRCRLIPERDLVGLDLRQLLYGRRQHQRRIIFLIHDDVVLVVHYRHGRLPDLHDFAGP